MGVFFQHQLSEEKYMITYFFQMISTESQKQKLRTKISPLTDREDTLGQRPSSWLNTTHQQAHLKSVFMSLKDCRDLPPVAWYSNPGWHNETLWWFNFCPNLSVQKSFVVRCKYYLKHTLSYIYFIDEKKMHIDSIEDWVGSE